VLVLWKMTPELLRSSRGRGGGVEDSWMGRLARGESGWRAGSVAAASAGRRCWGGEGPTRRLRSEETKVVPPGMLSVKTRPGVAGAALDSGDGDRLTLVPSTGSWTHGPVFVAVSRATDDVVLGSKVLLEGWGSAAFSGWPVLIAEDVGCAGRDERP